VKRVHLPSCASTNDEALGLARAGAAHLTCVIADAQTRGRGRAGRSWYSPPGQNLYLSIVWRSARPAAELPAITLAAGIGVCDAVRAAGVAHARLKWPNDVLAGERKLAGVLTEMSSRGGVADAVVIGIGVDVAGRRDELPPELAAIATSIRDETGAPQDLAAFTDLLLAALVPWLDRFEAGGVAAIAADWEARAELGRAVTVGTKSGTVRGLAGDGALRVALPDGDELWVLSGAALEIPRGPPGS